MIVGLTGGIGSGKTTVAKLFQAQGVAIFVSDTEAKKLMETSAEIHKELIALFGDEVIAENGLPDRKFIAGKVFNDKDLLEQLNQIIHPRVASYFQEWKTQQNTPYIIYEAAIIFEKNLQHRFDYTIIVTAPEEEKIKRVMKRDNSSEEEVKARIKNQWPDSDKIKLADFQIENNDLELTKTKVSALHKHLLSLVNA